MQRRRIRGLVATRLRGSASEQRSRIGPYRLSDRSNRRCADGADSETPLERSDLFQHSLQARLGHSSFDSALRRQFEHVRARDCSCFAADIHLMLDLDQPSPEDPGRPAAIQRSTAAIASR